MMLQVGLIGAGKIGQYHAQNLKQHFSNQAQLTHVHDPYLNFDWAREHNYQVVDSGVELIKAVDLVLICSPAQQHVAQIKLACEAGKAVFCEKPLALSSVHASELLDNQAVQQGFVQIGFNRRFDPDVIRLKQMVTDQQLMPIQILKIISRDPFDEALLRSRNQATLENTGNLFFDMSIHDFDMARYLVSSDVTEITVQTIDSQYNADIDSASILMRFANGTLCAIENSRLSQYGYDQRIEAFTNHGTVQMMSQRENHLVVASANGIETSCLKNFYRDRYHQAYINQFAHLFKCLQSNQPPSPNLEDGLQALLLAEHATKAMHQNQTVHIQELVTA